MYTAVLEWTYRWTQRMGTFLALKSGDVDLSYSVGQGCMG